MFDKCNTYVFFFFFLISTPAGKFYYPLTKHYPAVSPFVVESFLDLLYDTLHVPYTSTHTHDESPLRDPTRLCSLAPAAVLCRDCVFVGESSWITGWQKNASPDHPTGWLVWGVQLIFLVGCVALRCGSPKAHIEPYQF